MPGRARGSATHRRQRRLHRGFGLWIDGTGRLNHTCSFLGVETCKQTSTENVPAGKVTVRMLFETRQAQARQRRPVTVWANERQIGEGTMPHTSPSRSPVTPARTRPGRRPRLMRTRPCYASAGSVKKVVFDLKPAAHENEKAVHEHAAAQAICQGAADGAGRNGDACEDRGCRVAKPCRTRSW